MELCERCHQAEATVFICQIINGKMRNLRLCRQCGEGYITEAGTSPEALSGAAKPFPGALQDRLDALSPPQLPAKVTLPERLQVNDLAELLGVSLNMVSGAMIRLGLMVEDEEWLDFDKARQVCELLGVEWERERE